MKERFGEKSTEVCEDLAYHYLAAGDWAPALEALETARLKSHVVGAVEVARWYAGKLEQVLDRMIRISETDAERSELIARRDRLQPAKKS